MARSTFKVLFYLKRQNEKNGKVPVMGRITVNGTIAQFSCKLNIRPALWDTEANKAAGKSVEAQRINEKLENIKTNIGKQYQRISDRDSYVTADKVKNAWLGFGDGYQLLMQTFDEYLKDFKEKRVGKDRAASTLKTYTAQRKRLAAFLEYEYGLTDIPFKELKREFIEKYVVYLSTVRNFRSGSIPGAVKKLRLMTYTAFKNGWIPTDPFSGFRVAPRYRDRRFLSEAELRAVIDVKLPNYKTAIVRDIFSYCTALTTVDFESGSKLVEIDAFAFSLSGLQSIEIPRSVETIRIGAFEECTDLAIVTFEKGSQLKTLFEYTFNECLSLKTIDMSACTQVNNIHHNAFTKCKSLQLCKIGTVIPPTILNGTFNLLPTSTLQVPAESVDAYKKAYGWKDFPHITSLD